MKKRVVIILALILLLLPILSATPDPSNSKKILADEFNLNITDVPDDPEAEGNKDGKEPLPACPEDPWFTVPGRGSEEPRRQRNGQRGLGQVP